MFDFFKKIANNLWKNFSPKSESQEIDRSNLTGKDFEFLITGEIQLNEDRFDEVMTPNNFEWIKVTKDDWPYYQIGEDEFSYSWEIPGIQMTFNKEITYPKAKKIADEVIDNLNKIGQSAELIILDNTKVYKFR